MNVKPWLVPVFVLFAALLSYEANVFRVVPDRNFASFNDSGALVADALANDSDLLLTRSGGELRPYVSQFGLQAPLFGLLQDWLSLDIAGLRAINAAALAFVVAGIAAAGRSIFGTSGSAALGASLALSPQLVVFSGLLYWVTWTWYLPLLATLVLARKMLERNASLMLACALLFALFLLKFLCGYEYMSVVGTASITPLIFFGIRDKISVSRMIVCLVGVGAAFSIAFLVAILMHAAKIEGDIARGLQTVQTIAEKRVYTDDPVRLAREVCEETDPGASGTCISSLVTSQQSSHLKVVAEYLTFRQVTPWSVGELVALSPATDGLKSALSGRRLKEAIAEFMSLETAVFWSIVYTLLSMAICWFIIAAVVRKAAKGMPGSAPYAGMLAVAFLAPLTWYVLAMPHSAMHKHLNFVLWSLPTFPFLLGYLFSDRSLHVRERSGSTPVER